MSQGRVEVEESKVKVKLLLIEDEVKLSQALSHLLRREGYVADTAVDGEAGLDLAASGVYDLIILDQMLPGMDGLAVLKELRSAGLETPVLFLTAKDTLEDKVKGLDAGADDYLVKPFFSAELLARIRALTRRKAKEWVGNSIEAAGLILDSLRGEVKFDGKVITLTSKETTLLELLMINSGQVIPKERIYEKVWGYNSETDLANVDLYIHYLRKKLDSSCIRTVRGVGYCLQEDHFVS